MLWQWITIGLLALSGIYTLDDHDFIIFEQHHFVSSSFLWTNCIPRSLTILDSSANMNLDYKLMQQTSVDT